MLSVGAAEWLGLTKKADESDQAKREAAWLLMLNDLGIRGCDQFEMLVVEYLQSGLFDIAAISAIIERYISESDAAQRGSEARDFFQRLIWDHRLTDAELLEQASGLVPTVELLDPYMATGLHDAVLELPDGSALADEIISQWITGFKDRSVDDVGDDNDMFNRKLHPRIEAEFAAISATVQTNTTVFDACMRCRGTAVGEAARLGDEVGDSLRFRDNHQKFADS